MGSQHVGGFGGNGGASYETAAAAAGGGGDDCCGGVDDGWNGDSDSEGNNYDDNCYDD